MPSREQELLRGTRPHSDATLGELRFGLVEQAVLTSFDMTEAGGHAPLSQSVYTLRQDPGLQKTENTPSSQW